MRELRREAPKLRKNAKALLLYHGTKNAQARQTKRRRMRGILAG